MLEKRSLGTLKRTNSEDSLNDILRHTKVCGFQREKEWDQFCSSDKFDSFSVGRDITYKEFIENEMSGALKD